MSDRFKGCTVVFDRDIRDDAVENLLSAIRMLKGVASVEGVLAASGDYMARERVRSEVERELYQAVSDILRKPRKEG